MRAVVDINFAKNFLCTLYGHLQKFVIDMDADLFYHINIFRL